MEVTWKCLLKIYDHRLHQPVGVSLAALGPALYVLACGAVPLSPARGDVSALTGNDRFCNRRTAVKALLNFS